MNARLLALAMLGLFADDNDHLGGPASFYVDKRTKPASRVKPPLVQ